MAGFVVERDEKLGAFLLRALWGLAEFRKVPGKFLAGNVLVPGIVPRFSNGVAR